MPSNTATFTTQVAGDFSTTELSSNALGLAPTTTSLKISDPFAPHPSTTQAIASAKPTHYDEYASTDEDEDDNESSDSDSDADADDDGITYYGIRLDAQAPNAPNLRQFIPKDISKVHHTCLEQFGPNPSESKRRLAWHQAEWAYIVNVSKYIKAFRGGGRRRRLQESKPGPGFPKGFPYAHRFVDEMKMESDLLVNDDGRHHGCMGPKGGEWVAPAGSKLKAMSVLEEE